jgi:Protein of unknown function (DUF2905)
MIRWLLVTVLALLVFSSLMPWLRKIGFGRLPGDFNVRWRGRDVSLPLGSTILLSLIAAGIAKLL